MINTFIELFHFLLKYCGISKALKVEFLRNVSFLYHSWVFMTEEVFQSKYSVFNYKFSCYLSAKQFIDEN